MPENQAFAAIKASPDPTMLLHKKNISNDAAGKR